jgi:hypothetical protein
MIAAIIGTGSYLLVLWAIYRGVCADDRSER